MFTVYRVKRNPDSKYEFFTVDSYNEMSTTDRDNVEECYMFCNCEIADNKIIGEKYSHEKVIVCELSELH